jgi:hypothetical protein
VAGCNVHHNPFFLTGGDFLEDFGKSAVVRAYFVARVYVIDERQEVVFAQFLGFLGIPRLDKLQSTAFLTLPHEGKRLFELLNVFNRQFHRAASRFL